MNKVNNVFDAPQNFNNSEKFHVYHLPGKFNIKPAAIETVAISKGRQALPYIGGGMGYASSGANDHQIRPHLERSNARYGSTQDNTK